VTLRRITRNEDAAAVRLVEAHELLQRHRLAHAGAAQNAERFAGVDEKAYVGEDVEVAKGLEHILKRDVRLLLRAAVLFFRLFRLLADFIIVGGWFFYQLLDVFEAFRQVFQIDLFDRCPIFRRIAGCGLRHRRPRLAAAMLVSVLVVKLSGLGLVLQFVIRLIVGGHLASVGY
jgi:hypothetical protein